MAELEKNSEEKRGSGLKPIRETISRLVNGPAGKSSEADLNKQRVEKKTGDCECKDCGKIFTGEITVINFSAPEDIQPKPPREFKASLCPECQAKVDAAVEKERQAKLMVDRLETVRNWRRTCGIPPELAAKTFKNFEKSRQGAAYNDALSWAKGFNLENPKGYPSLIFYSDTPGLGKTHLMAGIADYILTHWQGTPGRKRSPIIFVKGPHLVRRIRWTYSVREEEYYHEREEEVYREITGVPLLLLDDVGKETPSKFTRETYWYIIDERVTSGLPVIITSRLPLEGDNSLGQLMGEDTVDRLYGMCRGEVTEMTGKSYRREKEIP